MAIVLDGTNGITAPDGSAASPAYKQQDANTGISGSADQLVLSTAGTERIRVASAGQLGIAGANYGTDGQVLTSTGASSAPAWESGGNVTRAAAHSSHTTGEGTIEFASLPSTAYWHRMTVFNLSTTDNIDVRWQLGTSSAYVTSGYKTSCGYLAGGSSTAVDGDTGWMRTDGATAGSNNKCMTLDFNRVTSAGHYWVCRAYTTESGYNYWYWTAAEVDVGGALEKIKIYCSSGSFDNGLWSMESFT